MTYEEWKPYPAVNSPLMLDSRGVRRTASLFFEVTADSQLEPIFTMRDADRNGCVSAYDIYISSIDEADAAMKMLGSMTHWRKLLKCKWFIEGSAEHSFEGLNQWRQDMLSRDMTRLKAIYLDDMRDGDLNAAKAMLALIEKERKLLSALEKEGKGTDTPSRTNARRGNQKAPQGDIIDFSQEMNRLKG